MGDVPRLVVAESVASVAAPDLLKRVAADNVFLIQYLAGKVPVHSVCGSECDYISRAQLHDKTEVANFGVVCDRCRRELMISETTFR